MLTKDIKLKSFNKTNSKDIIKKKKVKSGVNKEV